MRCAALLAMVFGIDVLSPIRAADDLLPDLVVKESDLHNHDVVTDGHRVLLRLTTTTPNIGEGPFHVIGEETPLPNGNRLVHQRIFQSDGNWYDRPAGEFENHPTHNHVHLEGWAIYRVREYLIGGGVGPVLREGDKTSFCLLDVRPHDLDLPGAPSSPVYATCHGDFQGISVGWSDIYTKELYGQNIDVKDLPHGTYWLEVEVDPDNNLLELNEGNNITRIEIQIGEPVFIDGPLEEGPEIGQGGKVDLRIGRNRAPASHKGNNIYDANGRGARQALRLRERRTRKIRFFGSVQNEGGSHQHFPFRASGRNRRILAFRIYDITGSKRTNFTGRAFSSGYLYHLDPGIVGTFRAEASLNRKSKKLRKAGRRIRVALIFRVSLLSARDSTRALLRFD